MREKKLRNSSRAEAEQKDMDPTRLEDEEAMSLFWKIGKQLLNALDGQNDLAETDIDDIDDSEDDSDLDDDLEEDDNLDTDAEDSDNLNDDLDVDGLPYMIEESKNRGGTISFRGGCGSRCLIAVVNKNKSSGYSF